MDEEDKMHSCSLCGKSRTEVGKLVAGPSGYICDECIKICHKTMTEEQKSEKVVSSDTKLPTPKEINAFINDYVIGQERAKKILSVAVCNHYMRLRHKNSKNDDVELNKSNILLIGPTGSGKTLLAETLARTLNVPFAVADATTITETGYVGDDVETMLQSLLRNCDFDVKKAETGIIYIDEIDKISSRNNGISVSHDISGGGVQQDLLKLIEGTVANVPVHGKYKHEKYEHYHVNTKNILFICGGTFSGLDKIIKARTEKHGIGFGAEIYGEKDQKVIGELLRQIKPEDLVKYGFIPEFIGRLPIIAVLDEIEEPEMVRILKEPKNSLVKQYQKLFSMYNVEIVFQDEALTSIVKKAVAEKTGARGLRSILENLLLDTMYNLPQQNKQKRSKILVNQKFINNIDDNDTGDADSIDSDIVEKIP